MNKKLKIAIPVVAGVLALSIGAGVAAAKTVDQDTAYGPAASYQVAGSGPDEDGATGLYHCGGAGGFAGYGGAVTPQVASLLGATVADIETQLKSGKTLADIAGEKGISQDQLIETMMAPHRDHLDLMVKYGYMDQAWADSMSQQLRERLRTTVTGKLDYSRSGWGRMGGMMSGWGGPGGPRQQPGGGSTPQGGFGGMMGGYSGGMMGGYGGGMMGRW